jgi:hypothetical protein
VVVFFDSIDQNRLVDLICDQISDGRVLQLIRGFLEAGVIADGGWEPTKTGVPQGGVAKLRSVSSGSCSCGPRYRCRRSPNRRSWAGRAQSRRNAVMSVKLYAFTCGTVTGEFAHLMEGGEGDITVPVPVFLVEPPERPGVVRHRAAPRLPA